MTERKKKLRRQFAGVFFVVVKLAKSVATAIGSLHRFPHPASRPTMFVRVLTAKYFFEDCACILGAHYGVDPARHQQRSREPAVAVVAVTEAQRTLTRQIA